MRVLVLDGNENQAVASVRSLSRAGHEVVVGAPTAWSKAGWSRHAHSAFVYPSPEVSSSEFVQSIAVQAARLPGTLVLPMTERTTLPLSESRGVLEAVGARMVLPSHETVLRAFDKAQTTALAASLGIEVPRTQLLLTDQEARDFAERALYPVVLKPRASEELDERGKTMAGGAPAYAKSKEEFAEAFSLVRRRSRAVLAQEYVEGSGTGYFALVNNGEVQAQFAHRRIRDVRPSGSGSALRESIAPDSRVRDASVAMLRALGWHGVAMVEFRVRTDGSPVFLEVNGRFWNSLSLPIHAGVDFPTLVAALAERGEVAPVMSYRVGVRCRWLLGDVRHLIAVWAGPPEGYTGSWPGRLKTLASFLTPVPGTFHDNFQLDDPLPELGDWLDFIGRQIPRALAART